MAMAMAFGFNSTRNIRKRRAAELSDDDDDDELLLSQSDIKKKKPFLLPDDSNIRVCSSSSSVFCFDSSGSVQVDHDSRAAAAAVADADSAETLKRGPKSKSERSGRGGGRESLYKGMGGYADCRAAFRREKGGYGPLRAPAHVRASARFDYQPDVCKDYKETGFCGYGDACKFLHDRGDYKSGWQLDKEWEDAKKEATTTMPGRRGDDDGADGTDADGNGEESPFSCSICRLPFRDPVVTKCKHYFCGNCALKLYLKNKKCFVCNKPTLGIFNTAHEIRKKMAALDRGT